MIASLFIFQGVLAGLIIFTTYMMLYKYKSIEDSLGIYTSTRAYRTRSSIAFIDQEIRKYSNIEERLKDKMDLPLMIETDLCKEYIGRFPYISVKNIATKTKLLMWGIILIEVLVTSMNGTVFINSSIIMIGLSVILTIATEIFTIVKAIQEQHEVVIMMVEDYLVNTYPNKMEAKELNEMSIKEKQTVSQDNLELEKSMEENHNQKKGKDELSEEDIAKLIGIFQ